MSNLAGLTVCLICFGAFLICMSIVYTKISNGLRFPKSAKSKTARRPIAKKGKRSRRDNPLKQHLRRWPYETSRAFAERCAAFNRQHLSEAQQEAASALRSLGMKPEFEVVVEIEGRFVILDILCRTERLVVEADGFQHRLSRPADEWRDEKLKAIYGYRTIRKWNGWFMKPCLRERLLCEIGRL